MALIHAKTAAGRREIEDRGLRLAPALRSVLLLVDGQRDSRELQQMAQGLRAPEDVLEQLLALNPTWLLVAHYREESIVKRWQQDPLWQMLTAAQKQQTASVDSNAWARMRGIFAAERIASDTVKIFHHQPLSDVK